MEMASLRTHNTILHVCTTQRTYIHTHTHTHTQAHTNIHTLSHNTDEPRPPPSTPNLNPRLAELATEVRDLNTRFSTMCIQARQHYSSLSQTMAAVQQDTVSLHSFSFSLSSPTADRKVMRRGSGSFDFDGAEGKHHHHHRHSKHHHKKSKGKRRDRLSLSLEPDEQTPHPLSRATKVQSVHLSHNLTISTSMDQSPPPADTGSGTRADTRQVLGETDKNLPKRAIVTDLDGFPGGGDRGEASVDSTSPSNDVTAQQPATSSTTAVESNSASLDDTKKTAPAAVALYANTSNHGTGVVLRRGHSLPEAHTQQKRDSSGGLKFVRELGLVQIREEGTRGLRPRSALLLSDSEQDLTAAVKAAISSPGSGQAALLNKAIKRRSVDFGERRRSSSSITLHTLSEMDAVESFEDSSSIGR